MLLYNSCIVESFQKLYETNSVIDSMRETLRQMEPKLAKKSIAVAELMKNLENEKRQADKVRSTVMVDEENAKVPNQFQFFKNIYYVFIILYL